MSDFIIGSRLCILHSAAFILNCSLKIDFENDDGKEVDAYKLERDRILDGRPIVAVIIYIGIYINKIGNVFITSLTHLFHIERFL